MNRIIITSALVATLAGAWAQGGPSVTTTPLRISGVYPHLAVFNEGDGAPCHSDGDEGGIGAVVPWAGKLWMITYSPHCLLGSSDKLYSISDDLQLTIHPESVGGTPANRLVHRESNQLIIGPYFISAQGKVRVIPPEKMPGRLTATARHLHHPESMVYFYDMEGMVYEADVNTLAVTKLFHKPVPGWHGKGGYTAQGRLIISNNGERKVFDIDPNDLQAGGAPESAEDMGVLASWDGDTWEIIQRRQFTDVTGPGGIYGAPDDKAPAWSIGWDKRSVLLNLLDSGTWHTYRLPKSTNTYDHWGGWYTEWPRIRDIGRDRLLMDMHGMFYEFPRTFSRENSSGVWPVSTHLRYVPDFCEWNGQVVLATDETTKLENKFAGRSQSNLWFGSFDDMKSWGTPAGWGGVWSDDAVRAGEPSLPFLINGFDRKVLHLAHASQKRVKFTLQVDRAGNHQWIDAATVEVPAGSYKPFVLPAGLRAQWARVTADTTTSATAWFHLANEPRHAKPDAALFSALASVEEAEKSRPALLRPAASNKNLISLALNPDGTSGPYSEVNEKLTFSRPEEDKTSTVRRLLELTQDFRVDDASVIVSDKTGTFRLPKGDARYDKPFTWGWPRGLRELESERYMLNAHGTFYEVPREGGFARMRPVTTHNRAIADFCTWRGLLVLSGTRADARPDGHYFAPDDEATGLWFGAIDDLWKLGAPRGSGGVWKDTPVKAGETSLPYLMTGYADKTLTMTSDTPCELKVEVTFDHETWHTYDTFRLKKGEPARHRFPDGYNAHLVRVTCDREATVTAWLEYR